MPIRCTLGENCVIQQFVDHDIGVGVQDYRCGHASYNGHKGTDFRVTNGLDFSRGVAVIAAASGRVKGARDGEEDFLKSTTTELERVKGKECGNGLTLDHGQGWETQYCHLREGSLRFEKGDGVEVGETIGFVGLSGHTQFTHLHFSVRHDSEVIDPFTGKPRSGACDVSPQSIWNAESQLAGYIYRPTRIINAGIADAVVDRENVDAGSFENFRPYKRAPILVGYARVINVLRGDVLQVSFQGPDGVIAEKVYEPYQKNRAVELRYFGKKRPKSGWPSGAYSVNIEIFRGGEVIDTKTVSRLLRAP